MSDGTVLLFYAHTVVAGGAERLLVEEYRYLRRNGHDVSVATFAFDPRASFDVDGFEPIVLGGSTPLGKVARLRRFLSQHRPGIVVCQSHVDCWYMYLATLGMSIPYATHIHGTFWWSDVDELKYARVFRRHLDLLRKHVFGHSQFIPSRPPRRPPARRLAIEVLAMLDWLAVRKARQAIVLTNQVRLEVELLYGRDCHVCRGCLPAEVVQKGKALRKATLTDKDRIFARPTLLSVGRLDPKKRIDVLIQAFVVVAREYPNLDLAIGGIGPEEPRLKDLARDLGLGDRVKFLGFIPELELVTHYVSAQAFLFPSWTTSGITPYEALAVGTKVVWTSEADEPILDDPLVTVAPPTVEGFADGIVACLANDVPDEYVPDLTPYTWDAFFGCVVPTIMGSYAARS